MKGKAYTSKAHTIEDFKGNISRETATFHGNLSHTV
jgi:hypothetical protein